MRWSVLAVLLAAPVLGAAQAPPAGASEPFVVEYYYKTRWGFADEFIRLFKKNHFPVLKREIELGHIQRVTAEAPRFHGTEDGRWDYRVTIVWKNAAAPHEPFPEAELKRLFPDQDTFRREEQRRFEILAAHRSTIGRHAAAVRRRARRPHTRTTRCAAGPVACLPTGRFCPGSARSQPSRLGRGPAACGSR